jgi:hypothetical protein
VVKPAVASSARSAAGGYGAEAAGQQAYSQAKDIANYPLDYIGATVPGTVANAATVGIVAAQAAGSGLVRNLRSATPQQVASAAGELVEQFPTLASRSSREFLNRSVDRAIGNTRAQAQVRILDPALERAGKATGYTRARGTVQHLAESGDTSFGAASALRSGAEKVDRAASGAEYVSRATGQGSLAAQVSEQVAPQISPRLEATSSQASKVSDRLTELSSAIRGRASQVDTVAPEMATTVSKGAQDILGLEAQVIDNIMSNPQLRAARDQIRVIEELATQGNLRDAAKLAQKLRSDFGLRNFTRPEYLGAAAGDYVTNLTGMSPLGTATRVGVEQAGNTISTVGAIADLSTLGGAAGPLGAAFKSLVVTPGANYLHTRALPRAISSRAGQAYYSSGQLGADATALSRELDSLLSRGVPVNEAVQRLSNNPTYGNLTTFIRDNGRRLRDIIPGMSPLNPGSVRRLTLSGIGSTGLRGGLQPEGALGNRFLGAVGEAEAGIARMQEQARQAAISRGMPVFERFEAPRIRASSYPGFKSDRGFTYNNLTRSMGGEAVAGDVPELF